MIPSLNQSGVLPPFLPNAGPTESAAMAPYQATLVEIVQRFASSPERVSILNGLLRYREKLRSYGIIDGFQWIDGSYLEDCEKHRSRPPSDIDLVTFAERPVHCSDLSSWKDFVAQNRSSLLIEMQSSRRIPAMHSMRILVCPADSSYLALAIGLGCSHTRE